MKDKPKISVIVTAAGTDDYLAEALNSLKKQSLRSIEMIVVADRSPKTASIAASFTSADKRFSYIARDDYTSASARNAGLDAARGEYLIFLDGNDLFTPHFLESMLDTAQKNSAPLTVGRMCGFDEFGDRPFSSTIEMAREKLTNGFDTDLIWNPSISNKLFLRERINETGLRFSEHGAAQEAEFSLCYALGCDTVACCQKSYSKHRYLPFSLPSKDAVHTVRNYMKAYNVIAAKADEEFAKKIEAAETDFEKRDFQELETHYANEVMQKELTVLFYRFYRRFWLYSDADLQPLTELLSSLVDRLSKSGKKTFYKNNSDIISKNSPLVGSRAELAANPLITIALCSDIKKEQLEALLDSIYSQVMPSFEVVVNADIADSAPERYSQMPNLRFGKATDEAFFRDFVLTSAKGKYIVFLDRFVLLDTKILMRHFNALEQNPERGFSTSPISVRYNKHSELVKFNRLAFEVKPDARRSVHDDSFVLDLFFPNKMFRTEHLRGIKFSFSLNGTMDIYKIYNRSSFIKVQHNGIFVTSPASSLLAELVAQENILPAKSRVYYKKSKKIYQRRIVYKHTKSRISRLKARIKHYGSKRLEAMAIAIHGSLPLKNRALFYAARPKNLTSENLRSVWGETHCKKIWLGAETQNTLVGRLRFIKRILRSRVIVTDGTVPRLSKLSLRHEQKVIQLWHACGAVKRFALDAPLSGAKIDEWRAHRRYSLVPVSSEYVRQFYAHAFGIDLDKVQALGSPQTDILAHSESREKLRADITAKHPCLRGSKVYLYCPTFRDKNGVIKTFDPKIDWAQLDSLLEDDELFIIHKHPLMTDDYLKGRFYDHVKDYSFESAAELLSCASLVITDYSTVVLDGSLINLPMVFYCPDFKTYERDFYINYPEDLPGPVIYEPEKLLETVRSVYESPDLASLEEFRQKQVGACDGESAKRIAKAVAKEAKM